MFPPCHQFRKAVIRLAVHFVVVMAASPVLAAVAHATPVIGFHSSQAHRSSLFLVTLCTTSAMPAAAHVVRAGWSLGLRPAKRCGRGFGLSFAKYSPIPRHPPLSSPCVKNICYPPASYLSLSVYHPALHARRRAATGWRNPFRTSIHCPSPLSKLSAPNPPTLGGIAVMTSKLLLYQKHLNNPNL